MSKAKNIEVALEVLKYTLILGAGFFAVKVALDVKNGAKSAADAAKDAAKAALDAVNPTNPNNVAAKTVNAIGGAIVTAPDGPGKNADGSWTFGGFWRDITHPDEAAAVKAMSGPVAPAAQNQTQDVGGTAQENFRKSEIEADNKSRDPSFSLEDVLQGNTGIIAGP